MLKNVAHDSMCTQKRDLNQASFQQVTSENISSYLKKTNRLSHVRQQKIDVRQLKDEELAEPNETIDRYTSTYRQITTKRHIVRARLLSGYPIEKLLKPYFRCTSEDITKLCECISVDFSYFAPKWRYPPQTLIFL